ncbi:MAG TPA: DinB family protein [Thermomicrobiales bacterium]|nr:DinB family protein [Thermomicrobiales bacterium]
MTTRVEHLVAEFEAVNEEIIAIVARCSDEEWRRACTGEGWAVGVVAHHIATVHRDFLGLIGALAAGQTRSPGSSMANVDQSNARHACDHAAVGRQETLDALRENGAAAARQLRDLRDEQLDRVAGVFGGHELSVAQVLEWVVIGHAREHLASIRATLDERAVHAD